MIADLRYACRTLLKAPSFAVAAIATLAIGIAANTIVFTLVNAILLKPLPVPDAGRVVRARPIAPTGQPENLVSYADFLDYREQAQGFEAMAVYRPSDITIGRSSLDAGFTEPLTAVAYLVSPDYFLISGMRPSLGRLLGSLDERETASPAVVIGYTLWMSRFAGNPEVVGSTLFLNGRPFTVVGVGSRAFMGTEPLVADVWVPIAAHAVVAPDDSAPFLDRDPGRLLLIARLAPHTPLAVAEESLTVVARRLAQAYPGPSRASALLIAPATFFTMDPGLKSFITLVMASVGLLLLIACANVANLMLARTAARQREIAVRLAIGASRWRVMRELLTETLLLGLLSGGVALLISEWTLRVLYKVGVSLVAFPWAIDLNLTPDWRVFTFTFLLAAAGGTLFGIVPALQTSTHRIAGALHENGLVLGTRTGRSRLRNGLVVTQIACSLVLLVAAGLLTRSLQRARTLDLGFSADHVVYTEYDLRKSGYSPARAVRFTEDLRARVSRLPGVSVSALTSHVPLHGGIRRADARVDSPGGTRSVGTVYRIVSPDYFDALRIPITAGRTFNDDDRTGRVPGVIISEGLAARFWPGENPLGRSFVLSTAATPFTVVGLARDSQSGAIWREKELTVYLPIAPSTDLRTLRLLIRTDTDTAITMSAARQIAGALDPDVRFEAVPLETLLRLWILPSRVAAAAAGVLGLLALALASIGIYGVLAYLVSQRTREIGIRMALGARSTDVLRLVLRQGSRLTAIGLALGVGGAAAGAPLLRVFLFDLSPADPIAFAGACCLLAGVALAACYVPARRAARLQPLSALRIE